MRVFRSVVCPAIQRSVGNAQLSVLSAQPSSAYAIFQTSYAGSIPMPATYDSGPGQRMNHRLALIVSTGSDQSAVL